MSQIVAKAQVIMGRFPFDALFISKMHVADIDAFHNVGRSCRRADCTQDHQHRPLRSPILWEAGRPSHQCQALGGDLLGL
jgi:hypothetical protein